MADIITNRDKIVLKKLLLAEDERKFKDKIKQEINSNKRSSSMKLEFKSKKISDMQTRLYQEYEKREKKNLLKSVKEKTVKLHENIILHRKVIKQLLEQESKIIRKSKQPLKKFQRMPYLKNIKHKLIESMELAEEEQDELDFFIPPYALFPKHFEFISLRSSLSPSPQKPKVLKYFS